MKRNTFLHYSFGSMIILDYILTVIAMQRGGFYETNPFTNTFTPMIHMVALLCFIAIIRLVGERFKEVEHAAFYTLLLGTMIWAANNIYSVILLW